MEKQERLKRKKEFEEQILPILQDEYNVRIPTAGAYCISPAGEFDSITYYPMADKIHVPDRTKKSPGKWIFNGLDWIFKNLIETI